MPTSSPLITKSTLRHRPITSDVEPKEPPRVPRASRTQTQKPQPAPAKAETVPTWKQATPASSPRRPRALLIGVGMGMALAVVLVALGQGITGWMQTTWDTLHYGYPRTFQIDAVVGHGGDSITNPTHLIALNLKGQLEVIELPAGNASAAKIFVGPRLYGPHADLVPATVQVVGRQHNLALLFQGQQVIFRNVHGTFQANSTGT